MARKKRTKKQDTAVANGRKIHLGQSVNGIDVWRIIIYRGYEMVKDKDGVERKRTKQDKHVVYGSYRQAKREKSKLVAAQDEGSYTAPNRVTLKDFLSRWMKSTRRREVRQRTQTQDTGLINKHILPALGDIPLQRLSTRDIDDYYELAITPKQKHTDAGRFNGSQGLGLSPASVRKHHNLLT